MTYPPAYALECEPEWQVKPVSTLVMHISEAYYDHTRSELPLLWEEMLDLAPAAADTGLPHLQQLATLLAELRDHVDTHARTENDLLFPVLVALEYPTVLTTRLGAGALMQLVTTLSDEHTAIRRVLGRLTAHLRDDAARQGTGPWRDLRRRLERFRDHLIEQLDLEDRCLLPRARQMARLDDPRSY